MGIGRPPQTYDKERISLNIARLKKGGENFEIILKDPDLAVDYKHGKEIDITDIINGKEIFKNARQGEVASEHIMQQIFETTDPFSIADAILKKGELHLTADQRRKMIEDKKTKIINFIHMNAIDPKTGLPHPAKRIELAMDEAKVQINEHDLVEWQIDKIVPKLRPIIPIKFEKFMARVNIPAKYAGHAYGTLKGKYNLSKEKWLNDGSIQFEIDAAAGLKPDIINAINKLSYGEAQIEDIKSE